MKQLIYIFLFSTTIYSVSYAKDLKKDFETDLMGKTEAEVLKFRGKPEKISACPEYKSLQLKALYWKITPHDDTSISSWYEIVLSKKDGKVCSDGTTTGANCRELHDGSCGLPILDPGC